MTEDRWVIADRIPHLKSLSPEEKLLLAGELWNELASQPGAFPPREGHVQLLRQRLEHYRRHPEDVVAWENIKKRIIGGR